MPLSLETYKKIFVINGLVTESDFSKYVELANQSNQPLDQLLIEQTYLSISQYLQLLGDVLLLPTTDLKISSIDRQALAVIPENFATQFNLIAYGLEANILKVAVSDPNNAGLAQIQTSTGHEIKLFITTDSAIKRALLLYNKEIQAVLNNNYRYVAGSESPNSTDIPDDKALQDLSVAIVESAILLEASDIHIEPFETDLMVRFRVDGYLRTINILPKILHEPLVSRLKVLSNMKIDQKRLPQDGRFAIDAKGQKIDLRVSTVPSLWGEKIVLRVLSRDGRQFDIKTLGLLDSDIKILTSYLKRPFGMILVCGPTGSGKTTSLYACLKQIGSEKSDVVNISTIEDPIEYTMPRVTQIQTQPSIDLTFATGLRAILRQDPDIIMVGEIRDPETASFAVRASLVGRLVLSSLHTNDAAGAIPRLLDLGVEPYLVSSTLSLVIAQRLARKLCIFCRQSYTPSPETVTDLTKTHDMNRALRILELHGVVSKDTDLNHLRFYKPTGCDRCGKTGYNGRVAVVELLPITEALKNAINNREQKSKIESIAKNEDMKTMFEDGIAKVILGEIDLSELIRVVYQ